MTTRFRMPVAGLLFILLAGAILFACGGDDDDVSTPVDGGADVDSSTPQPDTFVPPQDTGAADTQIVTDAGADACGTLQITSINPIQGYSGVDIVVQVAGSGFAPCGGPDGGTACVDELTLSAAGSCGDAGIPPIADASDDGSDGAGDADAGDADAANVPINDAGGGATCADAGAVSIKLKTLRSDGNVLTAVVPAGSPLGGPYDLLDSQNGCTARLNNAYTVLPASSSITITKVTPAYGWTGEDTPVTIQGSGFVSTPTAYINVPGMVPEWQKLKNVAFTSSTSISGVVPKGLIATPAGPKYAIAVLNPDGQGNQLPDAFRVVSLPVPSITTVTPSSLTTSQLGVADNVTITGCNFRNTIPLTVATVTAAGAVANQTPGALTCTGPATCAGGSNVCTLKATINTGLATGPYLVRVTNADQNTSGDYATLVITNPSAKLDTGFATSTHKLLTGRRSLVTTSARINEASRFLYAIGGEKADNTILDTAEVAPLDPFGVIGDWFVQRNKLTTARSGASVAQVGQYMYVIGGTSTFITTSGTGGAAPTGTPLATIERAKILDATDIPGIGDPTTQSTGTLGAGSWYYRVSGVRDATDPDNKNGETLPSDEVVGSLGFNGSIVLTWTAPPNATHLAKYRVYRTPTVNGKSGDEVLIAETADATVLTFTDDGTKTAGTEKPLARGSTSTWSAATSLVHARLNAGATIAKDDAGQAYVYIVGGWGKCDGAGVDRLMNCYEYATITADGKTLGAFTAGANTLLTARQRAGVARMSADNGPLTWTGTASFVVVAGGLGPAVPGDTVEVANVTTGGVLGTFAKQTNPQPRDATALQAANGFFYQFGGATSAATYQAGNVLTDVSAQTATTLTLNNWSNATSSFTTARGRMGATLESAFFYFVGGTSNDANALDTVEQIIY